MSIESLVLFCVLVGFAAYVHTVSGFGLGMVVMGSAAIVGLAPIPVIAAVNGLITLANGALALPGALHHVYWRGALAAIAGVIPATAAGFLLLGYLSASASQLLRVLLGILIASGALHLFLSPRQRDKPSGFAGFFGSGLLGGFFGGLFGIPGPPVIYHYYRQPLPAAVIRNSLLLLFAAIQGGRTLLAGVQGQLIGDVWILTLIAIPAVALATLAGRRYPPRIGMQGMRRFVAAMLLIIGGGLIVDGLTPAA